MRVTSPSSVTKVSAISSPTPNWVISAWQPVWRRATRRRDRSIPVISRSSVSITPSATVTRSRASSGSSRRLRNSAAVRSCDPSRRARANPVVIEHRPDPHKPLRALIDQRLSQVQPRTPLTHMLSSDPRLGQPPLREQLAQPQRVLAVGLSATLAPPQRPRLHGLGQMRNTTRARDRPSNEQPASARPASRHAPPGPRTPQPTPERPTVTRRSAHARPRPSPRPNSQK